MILLFVSILVILIFLIYNNKKIVVSKYQFESAKIDDDLDEYKIVHLSDIHNDVFGIENKKLIDCVKKCNPNLIVITGDLIDSRRTDVEIAYELLQELVKIAKVAYTTGNHEFRISGYSSFEGRMKSLGVIVLRDEKLTQSFGNGKYNLFGIDDPSFHEELIEKSSKVEMVENKINTLKNLDLLNVLIVHRPELFDAYVREEVDLVLCGHAHGGQIRIPFIGGVIAPHQGFFPKFDAGLYKLKNTSMIVSRGLGRSAFPLRVNNNPEVVLIKLKKV